MKWINGTLYRAILIFFIFTILCGVIYPFLMTAIAQATFPEKANGSLIEIDGKLYGSELLGQQFTDESHMWGRVMQIDTTTYKDSEGNPLMYAYPANLSPASSEYEELVAERVAKIRKAHPTRAMEPVPIDLVTSSGSGLDPNISVLAAMYQVERLAETKQLTVDEVKTIISECTESRFLGLFGEKVVNVLKVNLLLEEIQK